MSLIIKPVLIHYARIGGGSVRDSLILKPILKHQTENK